MASLKKQRLFVIIIKIIWNISKTCKADRRNWKSTRMLRRVLLTLRDFLSLRLLGKNSS